ncbi:hypothetical protein [Streptomyces chartreusis]
MSTPPLALALANQLLRPAFGSRRSPDRIFDRIVVETGEAKGGGQFVDGCRALLGWWARADNLTPVGWQSAQVFVRRHLANRARIRRLIAEHPEIEREPIEKPVFVVGLPRTANALRAEVDPA